jgi:hypothetical protein
LNLIKGKEINEKEIISCVLVVGIGNGWRRWEVFGVGGGSN